MFMALEVFDKAYEGFMAGNYVVKAGVVVLGVFGSVLVAEGAYYVRGKLTGKKAHEREKEIGGLEKVD